MPASQRGAANAAAVLVVAAVGMGAVAGIGLRVAAGDDGQPTPATVEGDTAAAFACPGGGPVVATLHRGDRILVTGRDRSGDWLELRAPTDLRDRVWVDAATVTADHDLGALPEHACPETTTLAAGATTTTAADATTTSSDTTGDAQTTGATGPVSSAPSTTMPPAGGPAVTTAPPTSAPPATAPAADTTGPSITQAGVDPPDVYERFGADGSCPGPDTGTVRARVTDPSGVASVQAHWRVANDDATRAMHESDSAFTATFGPYDWPTVPDGTVVTVQVTIRATDGAGNVSSATTTVRIHSWGLCFG